MIWIGNVRNVTRSLLCNITSFMNVLTCLCPYFKKSLVYLSRLSIYIFAVICLQMSLSPIHRNMSDLEDIGRHMNDRISSLWRTLDLSVVGS